jgi:pSer/pThr/pTyr-binding forkhead associated (FHA) protein
MLSGVETTKDKVLRIILAGQPELNQKLDAPELVQLAQRVRLRFHLTALSREEMEAYITHRLEVAGAQGREIFARDCHDVIYRYTGGTPRLVNTLCDTAMMASYAAERDHVSLDDLHAALDELQWVEFSQRPKPPPAVFSLEHDSDDSHDAVGSPGRPSSAAAPRPAATRPQPVVGRLVVLHEEREVASVDLRPGRIVIGRTPDNDLQIDSRFVSRHHCQVISSPELSVIEDLNSTNGIFLHQKRVRRHILVDGDVVEMGNHRLRYTEGRSLTADGHVDTLPGAQQDTAVVG